MAIEGTVCLRRKGENDEILHVFRQAHWFRFVNPLAQQLDVYGSADLSRLSGEVLRPVMSQYEVRGIRSHLAQLERIGNVPEQWSQCTIDE